MEVRRNKKIIGIALGISLLLLVGVLGVAVAVHAQTQYSIEDLGSTLGLGTADLKQTVINILKWLLGILALVAVSYIIYGGYIWLTSAGNPERIQKAKRIIINAVIGLVIVLISWAIVVFVARAITNATNGSTSGSPPCVPGDPLCPFPGDVGLEIRSITTDCKDPDLSYRDSVYICSGINIVFNRQVVGNTVKAAAEAASILDRVVVEKCTDGEGCALPSAEATLGDTALDGYPGDAAKNNQRFVDSSNTTFWTDVRAGASWAARLSADSPGKSVTFFHIPTYFEKNQWYRVSIPKSLQDVKGNNLSNCRESSSAMSMLPGCVDDTANDRYTWTFQTGTDIDTQKPVVSSSYPDSRYLKPDAASSPYNPDRSVPRKPTISIRYNKAIFFTAGDVEIIPYDMSNPVAVPQPDPTTGLGGTLLAPLPSTDYDAVSADDGRTIRIAMKPTKMLEKFTWYKIRIRNVIDLCSNAQDPEPFELVFETNDVVPGVQGVWPKDETTNACPNTPVFIRYTVSMYDINEGCLVTPPTSTTGHVRTPPESTPLIATATKEFNVLDDCPGTCPFPNNYCKVYAYKTPPGGEALKPNTAYTIGVRNAYITDDTGTTLDYGTFWDGSSKIHKWGFTVKPPENCVNPPIITSIVPPEGTDGQCVTVNGYNFDGNKDGKNPPPDVDEFRYNGTAVPDADLGAWGDSQFAAIMQNDAADPAGARPKDVPVTVRSMFPDPFGVLESPVENWRKIDGPASTGPCLMSLQPNNEYPGASFNATGRRFLNTSTVKRFFLDLRQPTFGASAWTDTKISNISTAPPPIPDYVPGDYDAMVVNDEGSSNILTYTVKTTPPFTPVVISRWPACESSCTGASIGAKFSIPLRRDSVTTPADTVQLLPCQTSDCTSFDAPVAFTLSFDADPPTMFDIVPNPPLLLPNKWYRVILKGSIEGDQPAPDGVRGKLAGLNFRSTAGPGDNDAYSWTFRTTTLGAEGCKLDKVYVSPADYTMRVLDENKTYTARAYTEPNSCSSTGQDITSSPSVAFSWSSPPMAGPMPKVLLTPGPSNWSQKVTAKNQTIPDKAEIHATVTQTPAAGPPIIVDGVGNLTIDFDYCTDDASCQVGGCTGSVCDLTSRRCTPFIKNFSPDHGDVGTWVGINGCHFGTYKKGTCVLAGPKTGAACDTVNDCYDATVTTGLCVGGSYVNYGGGVRGLWPDAAMCGPIKWTDTTITSEVPNRVRAWGSLSGGSAPFTIVRWDGKTASTSPAEYDQNGVKMPGICKLVPDKGSDGTKVKVIGQNFGATQTAGDDKAMFYGTVPDRAIDGASYPVDTWKDGEFQVIAPVGIANNVAGTFGYPTADPEDRWGMNEVRVRKGVEYSNIENFDVYPPGCSICSDDSMCVPGSSCGYNGCCSVSPLVIDKQPIPDAVNICRNSVVTATFDMAMDSSTINKTSVHFYQDYTYPPASGITGTYPIDVPFSYAYSDATKKLTINPGLMDQNQKYTVSLAERGSFGYNLDMELWSAPYADHPDGAPDRITVADWFIAKDEPRTGSTGALSLSMDLRSTSPTYTFDPPGPQTSVSQLNAVMNVTPATPLPRKFHVTGWVRYIDDSTGYNHMFEMFMGPPANWTRAMVDNMQQAGGGLITRCWGPPTVPLGACDSTNSYDMYDNAIYPGNPNGGLFKYRFTPYDSGWKKVDLVLENKTGLVAGLNITCFARRGVKVYCDDIEVTEVGSTTIRNTAGASLLPTTWSFTTADTAGICQVENVKVTPSNWTFTSSDPNNPLSRKQFAAVPYSSAGVELQEVPLVIEWKWFWSFSKSGYLKYLNQTCSNFPARSCADPTVDCQACSDDATRSCTNPAIDCFDPSAFCDSGSASCVVPDSGTQDVQSLPMKGSLLLRAQVRPTSPVVGHNKTVTGTSFITNVNCNNPWHPDVIDPEVYGFTDSAGNCTNDPAGVCTDYHFNLQYCLGDTVGKLLPDLRTSAVTQYAAAGPSSLLKEFLFKEASTATKDAIGIRIYNNIEGLSAAEWYAQNASNPKSTTSPVTVDGYDAVRDGTTVYVGAADASGSTINSRIYLISYNQGADQKVVNIYNQMLEAWFFNNNITGICDDTLPDEQQEPNKACLQRDLKRVAAVSDIVQQLRKYYTTNRSYPGLSAGSYLPQLSFSVWPSWKQVLSGDLKTTLPVDPVNKIVSCPASQAQDGSCWSEATKTFQCGDREKTHILGYTSKVQTKVLANMEYRGSDGFNTLANISDPAAIAGLCPVGSDCSCFDYQLIP